MLPAPLLTGRRIDFFQSRPEPHGAISDRQLWGIHAPAFEVEKHLAPTLGALAHPGLDCHEPFLATGGDANNHKGAELVILAPKTAVDTVGPDIDDGLIIESCVFPALVFLGLIALEARVCIRRQSSCIRTQKNFECRAHLAAGNPFEVEPGQARLQRLGAAHIGRHQGRAEGHRRAVF